MIALALQLTIVHTRPHLRIICTQGGRAGSSNPILSEDMFMLRMGKKLRRKERKAAAADAEDGIIGDASTIFSVQQMVAGGDKVREGARLGCGG